MDDSDDPVYRSLYDPRPDEVTLRESEQVESEDGMMEIRMPIASTGTVRNEGDDPLTASELHGMAQQVDTLTRGVFPEHGKSNAVDAGRYSQFEKLGYWADAELQGSAAADDEDLLMATARMPDPETLPAATGDYREALAILKEQAKRGIPISASIGWKGDENAPGGNDLLEASIVGIGADPRTSTEGGTEALARAAVNAGADPDDFVAEVERIVSRDARAPESDDARPFGPPGGDPNKWEDFDECVADVSEWDDIDDPEAFCGWAESQTKSVERAEYEVGDEMVEISPPDYMVNAADMAMQKSDAGLASDCGTGVGDERADQIRNDEVGPDVVAEIAAYLTSHEEDVTADGTPDTWSDEEWDDCGNMQYAKWGGLGTGTALEWAQTRANAVADARDEDLPYPERATDGNMTDDNTADSDPPDGGTTDEQDASDVEDETTERAPDDLTEDRLLTFTAVHYDGMDESDLMEATDAADAEFVGSTDLEELFDLVSVITGAEYGTVEDAMGALMESDDGEQAGDKPDDYDEDEDEDGERDLAAEVDQLREELQSVRSGETDVQTPGDTETDEEQAADDPDGERDTESDEDESETRDGPDWRA